jgi:hypothetical protein
MESTTTTNDAAPNVNERFTAALQTAAEISDSELQRRMLNHVLDLHAAWKATAQAFVSKHGDLLDVAATHIEQVASELQIARYPDLSL